MHACINLTIIDELSVLLHIDSAYITLLHN